MKRENLLIAVFEDEKYSELFPLTLTRPTYALRCGPSLIYEKILREFPGQEVAFFLREHLAEVFSERILERKAAVSVNDFEALSGKETLIINGRWVFDRDLLQLGEELIALKGESVVYAYVKRDTAKKFIEKSRDIREFLNLLKREIGVLNLDDAKLINHLWDLVEYNGGEILREFDEFRKSLPAMDLSELRGVHFIGNKDDIIISKSSKVYPCVVFDSSKGPIIVDEGVKILPNSFIEGPCYIGRGSWIVGGKVMEGTTIGPICRVGGEVEESIIHGYSNKYHLGFLGHSYVGEWVNLGANTTTSDLRNDYGPVKMVVNGEFIDTGKLKIGSFIGDHTKAGINSLFNTGSIVGVMCNLVTAGEPYPKYIPSFTWYIKGKIREDPGIDVMIESAKRMMARRDQVMTKAEESLYRRLYEKTERERREFAERVSKENRPSEVHGNS